MIDRLRPADMSVNASRASEPASSFGPVSQVEAGVLDVGYVDAGPRDGPAVLLLHGWPYDIHAFAVVAAILRRAFLSRIGADLKVLLGGG